MSLTSSRTLLATVMVTQTFMKKTTLLTASVAALGFTLTPLLADHHAAAENKKSQVEAAPDPYGPTIVEAAMEDEDLSTLVAALKAADLVETLKGDGPFTVFAPTNEAFEKLPDGKLDELLKPENKEKLQKILTYHVVQGKVMAADVTPGMLTTVAGDDVKVVVEEPVVMIDDAKVLDADVDAKNGVIHKIDSVLMPKM